MRFKLHDSKLKKVIMLRKRLETNLLQTSLLIGQLQVSMDQNPELVGPATHIEMSRMKSNRDELAVKLAKLPRKRER